MNESDSYLGGSESASADNGNKSHAGAHVESSAAVCLSKSCGQGSSPINRRAVTRHRAIVAADGVTGPAHSGCLRSSVAARGVSLDMLANEHAEAKKILGGVSVHAAAHFYERYGKTVKQQKTVPEVAEELIAGLKADKKSDYHIRDTERRLRVFGQQFPGMITEVEIKAIVEWLRNLKGQDNDGKDLVFAPKTRNHYRNADAKAGVVMEVFVTQPQAVKPLGQKLGQRMIDIAGIARIAETSGQRAGETQAVIDLAQQQHPAVAGEIADGKVGDDLARPEIGKV